MQHRPLEHKVYVVVDLPLANDRLRRLAGKVLLARLSCLAHVRAEGAERALEAAAGCGKMETEGTKERVYKCAHSWVCTRALLCAHTPVHKRVAVASVGGGWACLVVQFLDLKCDALEIHHRPRRKHVDRWDLRDVLRQRLRAPHRIA